ncbi:MAG TPA: zf-HC2 domain-containing protein [Gemmatimonadales bacterium]|nr:zf-HC2 domain-containing protein [Gemmatimonadales bacterium]
MTHPQADDLLLLAYGELEPGLTADVEQHLASCAACHERLLRLERGRVALDSTAGVRVAPWAALTALAAAAAVAAVLLTGGPSQHDRPRSWPEQRAWSATAGYIAGGQPLIAIDAQLTRLEQERSYVRP